MKKTILISLLGCGFAMADIAPVVHLTFDDQSLSNSGNGSYDITAQRNGSGDYSDAGKDYLGAEAGYSYSNGTTSTDGSYLSISGVSFANDFTLTFAAALNGSDVAWQSIFSVRPAETGNDNWLRLRLTGDSGLYISKNNDTEDVYLEGSLTEDFSRLTLVYTAENTSFSLYQDKSYLGSWSDTGVETTDNGVLSVGGNGLWNNGNGLNGKTPLFIDEVALYETALDADQIAGLVGKASGTIATGGTLPIPEPTTATLSLLTLAGLAARRRRK